MKNKKALIRGFVFALVAAVVLLTAYNLPQNAKKAETPVSETNAKAVQNETDVLELAENAQPSSEKAVSGNCETAEENEDVTDLPQENVQAEAETPPAAEPAVPENAETAVMPTPSEPEPAPQETEPYCTLSVRCDTILNNMSSLKEGKADIVPQNGVIYEERRVRFNEGESVFNLLQREMKINKIHMEFVNAPIYGSAYIEGIGNLYEFDCGDLSGWMYKVNGVFPNYGCSQYKISPGDRIEWVYTCDLGKDVGGEEQPRNGRKNETE